MISVNILKKNNTTKNIMFESTDLLANCILGVRCNILIKITKDESIVLYIISDGITNISDKYYKKSNFIYPINKSHVSMKKIKFKINNDKVDVVNTKNIINKLVDDKNNTNDNNWKSKYNVFTCFSDDIKFFNISNGATCDILRQKKIYVIDELITHSVGMPG